MHWVLLARVYSYQLRHFQNGMSHVNVNHVQSVRTLMKINTNIILAITQALDIHKFPKKSSTIPISSQYILYTNLYSQNWPLTYQIHYNTSIPSY